MRVTATDLIVDVQSVGDRRVTATDLIVDLRLIDKSYTITFEAKETATSVLSAN